MTQPIPLSQRRPYLLPRVERRDETNPERRSRQLWHMRELTDLNMVAARAAGQRIEEAEPEIPEEAGTEASATLALSRATRSVILIINTENRVAAGEQARPIALTDPRRLMLRGALHPLVAREPNLTRRAALRAQIDEAIDDSLLADLDEGLSLADVAIVIAESAGLVLDLAKVSDELLGMEPRPIRPENMPPGASPNATHGQDRSRDSP